MTSSNEEAIKSTGNMNLQHVGGVNYVTYELIVNVAKHFELMRQVKIRDDDVITVGFPRSGNHWAYEVVSMIINQETNFAEGTFYGAVLESMGDNIHIKLDKMASPRILTSHCRLHRIPSQVVDKKVKIIYLMRNPKDALVSLYKLMTSLKIETAVYRGSWNEFFQLQISGDFPWGSWFDHVLATEKFMNEHPECPIYIHAFEEMKKDPVGKIKDLCSFLGKPDTLAEQIATQTEFSNMKTVLLQGKMKAEKEKHMTEENSQFRKGNVGDWKTWFTVKQNEIFNKTFEEKMAGSKLGDLMKQYI